MVCGAEPRESVAEIFPRLTREVPFAAETVSESTARFSGKPSSWERCAGPMASTSLPVSGIHDMASAAGSVFSCVWTVISKPCRSEARCNFNWPTLPDAVDLPLCGHMDRKCPTRWHPLHVRDFAGHGFLV